MAHPILKHHFYKMASNVSGSVSGDDSPRDNHIEPHNEIVNTKQETKDEAADHPGSSGDDGAHSKGLFGYSDLHEAASHGQANSLKSLLSDDSSVIGVNGKTVDGGYTPLHLAASAGHVDCVKELLDCYKTDIHVIDAFGRTPLETAEQNFKSDVAKLLRSYGKHPNLTKVYLELLRDQV